jgi:hypothetical protein
VDEREPDALAPLVEIVHEHQHLLARTAYIGGPRKREGAGSEGHLGPAFFFAQTSSSTVDVNPV